MVQKFVAKSESPRVNAWYARGKKSSGLAVGGPGRQGTLAARLKQSTTHVEAGVELFRDAGSIPAASIIYEVHS